MGAPDPHIHFTGQSIPLLLPLGWTPSRFTAGFSKIKTNAEKIKYRCSSLGAHSKRELRAQGLSVVSGDRRR